MFNDPSYFITLIPALLIAFAFHEWAHATMADYLGDPTPRSQGRVNLNPFVHLDLFGTLMIFLSNGTFGWAKPIQTNPMYFRGNKQQAQILVSLAGVTANFIIGLLSIIISILIVQFAGTSEYSGLFLKVMKTIAALNITLGVINLLPIPPLDGFHALVNFLPEEIAANLLRFEQYGFLILILIFWTSAGNWIGSLTSFIFNKFVTVAYFILGLVGIV